MCYDKDSMNRKKRGAYLRSAEKNAYHLERILRLMTPPEISGCFSCKYAKPSRTVHGKLFCEMTGQYKEISDLCEGDFYRERV